ncbi:MAG: hypothetical protein R3C03_03195 [Pirellulaceae bacterium]
MESSCARSGRFPTAPGLAAGELRFEVEDRAEELDGLDDGVKARGDEDEHEGGVCVDDVSWETVMAGGKAAGYVGGNW